TVYLGRGPTDSMTAKTGSGTPPPDRAASAIWRIQSLNRLGGLSTPAVVVSMRDVTAMPTRTPISGISARTSGPVYPMVGSSLPSSSRPFATVGVSNSASLRTLSQFTRGAPRRIRSGMVLGRRPRPSRQAVHPEVAERDEQQRHAGRVAE